MALKESIAKLEALIIQNKAPGTKRSILNMEQVEPLLNDIRTDLSAEIENADSLMQQKEAILKQAEIKAQRIVESANEESAALRQVAQQQTTEQIEGAREEAGSLVQSSSIVGEAQEEAEKIKQIAVEHGETIKKEAEVKANAIIAEGEKEAAKRRGESDQYVREVLFTLEERLAKVLGQIREGLDVLRDGN